MGVRRGAQAGPEDDERGHHGGHRLDGRLNKKIQTLKLGFDDVETEGGWAQMRVSGFSVHWRVIVRQVSNKDLDVLWSNPSTVYKMLQGEARVRYYGNSRRIAAQRHATWQVKVPRSPGRSFVDNLNIFNLPLAL